jgi:nucleoside-diphosphate-sugar epimerase
MRILIAGASGFLGRALAARLGNAGHDLVLVARNGARIAGLIHGAEIHAFDFATDTDDDWRPRLRGVEAVINAAGIFRSTGANDFDLVHNRGPCTMFDACASAGVRHIIQISAQGAGDSAFSGFHRSKKAADDHLAELADARGEDRWIIVRPSIIVGRGGGSTALFSALAALPWPIRTAAGDARLRPLHVADCLDAIERVLGSTTLLPRRLDLVGAEAMTADELTRKLRHWLGLPPARFIGMPEFLWRAGARVGDVMPGSLLSRESLTMLRFSHPAGPDAAAACLGWRARPLDQALASDPSSAADRISARLFPLKPLLRLGLASIWITTGLVSAFIFPIAQSAGLVRRLGVGTWLDGLAAPLITYAGAALDGAIGLALLSGRGGAPLGIAQIGIMSVYTILATIAAPSLWLNPFGPLTKNIAVLLAILVWMILEDAS